MVTSADADETMPPDTHPVDPVYPCLSPSVVLVVPLWLNKKNWCQRPSYHRTPLLA